MARAGRRKGGAGSGGAWSQAVHKFQTGNRQIVCRESTGLSFEATTEELGPEISKRPPFETPSAPKRTSPPKPGYQKTFIEPTLHSFLMHKSVHSSMSVGSPTITRRLRLFDMRFRVFPEHDSVMVRRNESPPIGRVSKFDPTTNIKIPNDTEIDTYNYTAPCVLQSIESTVCSCAGPQKYIESPHPIDLANASAKSADLAMRRAHTSAALGVTDFNADPVSVCAPVTDSKPSPEGALHRTLYLANSQDEIRNHFLRKAICTYVRITLMTSRFSLHRTTRGGHAVVGRRATSLAHVGPSSADDKRCKFLNGTKSAAVPPPRPPARDGDGSAAGSGSTGKSRGRSPPPDEALKTCGAFECVLVSEQPIYIRIYF
ncbi:hypothetical protein EVAR_60411_1 [Eumeta japonica]|uniref:Uncharacterized protein n=1 Tax=Eumeta variegata TaxID=151549 RepID=A0A4C1YSS9_EUMVA|nr:hypothetical protein EVAR_60411_1 [Eumeta japonica]